MSSRGRKKVDDAILDYLSDLLTPPPDEPVSDRAGEVSVSVTEPVAAKPIEGKHSVPELPARPSAPKEAVPSRTERARGPVAPPVKKPASRQAPLPKKVALAEKPVVKPVPPIAALKVAPSERVKKTTPAGTQKREQEESATQVQRPQPPEVKPARSVPSDTTRRMVTARKSEASGPEVSVPDVKPVAPSSPANKAPEGYPAWADERFQVLLFEVAGLKLAVPLISLGSIYPIEERLTHLFGMPEWFMGLMPKGDLQIKVVDTALWVMPEKYDPGMRESARFVVTLHGTEWGLASHEIHESLTLHRDDVKWRQSRGKRPWLAGTVVQHMCALLDVEAFGQLLADSEHRHRQHPL